MEKICTRCNFRNPGSRKVCQVCGFAKFLPTATVDCDVVKPGLLDQTKSAALAAVEHIATAFKFTKQNAYDQTTRLPSEPISVPSREPMAFENNDLDSMIAWFKSYGVDRPLILEHQPVVVERKSNRAA